MIFLLPLILKYSSLLTQREHGSYLLLGGHHLESLHLHNKPIQKSLMFSNCYNILQQPSKAHIHAHTKLFLHITTNLLLPHFLFCSYSDFIHWGHFGCQYLILLPHAASWKFDLWCTLPLIIKQLARWSVGAETEDISSALEVSQLRVYTILLSKKDQRHLIR